ncbi:hypothetical protein JG688_00004106 [Phytophthora aleatoria]|uniref:Uncharacterized protein n=1 Tax=Phytophthora aleatoria TaxID=2496075 RepID=A0A8J5IRL3_9STRA|nr:hypothetical protein JG688_00004106 [Phytophthora aleatoria]
MVVSTKSFFAMLAMTALAAGVNGHGYMTEPAVTFLSSSTDNTQFIATIESSVSGFSGTFSGSPADNTAAFTTAFEASSYTSLKELINSLATITVTDATLTCGSCDPDETAQPLPETYVEWSHSSTEGFTSSHEGPCEVWCDDVRVFQDDGCAADYTSAPAELPYDRDACLGTSTLTFYWLALHSSTWQVYINCAPLESTTSTGATSKYAVSGSSSESSTTTTGTNSSTTSTASSAAESSTASSSYNFNTNFAASTSASTTDDTSSTTTAPASTSTAPTTTTDTPASTTSSATMTTDAPSSTATPTPTTSTDTSKCSVRRRLHRRKMVASTTSFSVMLATAMLAANVYAHGYMSDPAASASGLSGAFNGALADDTAAFTTAFESSSYSSRDPDETAQPLPDTYVEWAHSDSEGFSESSGSGASFTASHEASIEGPCEIWCDDVRVTTAPAQLSYDHDACLGSSVFTFYWLALHSSMWQVYVTCEPLEGTTSTGTTSKYAVSGASSGTSTSTTTSMLCVHLDRNVHCDDDYCAECVYDSDRHNGCYQHRHNQMRSASSP